MESNVKARLEKLQSIRTNSGFPVVLIGENPVLDMWQAIEMAKRAGVIYRWYQDGRTLTYRVAENESPRTCPISSACDVLCTLVEQKYFDVEEWKPTPEYAALLAEEPEEETIEIWEPTPEYAALLEEEPDSEETPE